MPNPDPNKTLSFVTPLELNQWLEQHHDSENELWIKVFKKKTQKASVTWQQIVIESLCWGWIDGIKKSIDDQAYLQRITPRSAKSNWSKKNTEHVARLIEEGRMQEAGMKHVQAAKADGRWQNAYVVSEITVPDDFIQALQSSPKAKQFYDSLNKSSRYVIAHGLSSAKKADTRARRFTKYLDALTRQEKPS